MIHVGPDRRYLIWTAFAIVLGFVFGAILLITGNILGCIHAHGLINFINLRRLGRLQVDVLDPPFDAPD